MQIQEAYKSGRRVDGRMLELRSVTKGMPRQGPGIYNFGYWCEDGMNFVELLLGELFAGNLYARCSARVHEEELKSRSEGEDQADVTSYTGMVGQ
jgi:hypothetical protein